MKQGKIWGLTELIFENDNFEVHRIQIKKNGYCSTHCHRFKYNMFYIESGILEVHIIKNDYNLTDITILGDGQKTVAKPGEYHFFKAQNDVIAYEIYYTEPIGEDIIRKTCGGIK